VQISVLTDLHPRNVVANRPYLISWLSSVETIIARFVFPQALGNAAAMYVTFLPGDSSPESACARPSTLLPRHVARNPQRKAFLSEQRVSTVSRPHAPDQPLFRKCAIRRRIGPGLPSNATRHKVFGASNLSFATLPMRHMIRMFATTYGLSVTSTPILLIGEFAGPMM